MKNCKLSNSHRFRPTFSCRSFDVYQRPAVDVLCCKLSGSVNSMVKSVQRNKIIRPRISTSGCPSVSVLMLCAPVFLFTSDSWALLGRLHCGLSIWLSLLAIFNTLFWVYVNFFHEKTDKTRKYSKSAIFLWYENGRRRLLGAQSINSEISFSCCASVTAKSPPRTQSHHHTGKLSRMNYFIAFQYVLGTI